MITTIAGITALIAALGVAIPKILGAFKARQAAKAEACKDKPK